MKATSITSNMAAFLRIEREISNLGSFPTGKEKGKISFFLPDREKGKEIGIFSYFFPTGKKGRKKENFLFLPKEEKGFKKGNYQISLFKGPFSGSGFKSPHDNGDGKMIIKLNAELTAEAKDLTTRMLNERWPDQYKRDQFRLYERVSKKYGPGIGAQVLLKVWKYVEREKGRA